ncbi:MAG: signal recognition particle-docking protein FtsY [Bacteroidota bacterium]|nr:signal recognition particle-docking protein FtsY [Bacteroidota bacterium]
MFCWFNKKSKATPEEADATRKALTKTRSNLLNRIGLVLTGKSKIDADVLEELEEALLLSDVGMDTTETIIDALNDRAQNIGFESSEDVNRWLAEIVDELMPEIQLPVALNFELNGHKKPYVILVVVVNGVGKTTTIGKMAHQYAQQDKKVILGAADTFRAAAVDQLNIWKNRTGVEIVSHGMNADPAAVAYDAIKTGVDRNADVVIIDTAGRLHNKVGLMNELAKIKRVVQKFKEDAPDEVLLVVDATTGQNAFEQARAFTEATKVNVLAVTKLDGTAKGGVVIGVSHAHGIPVKYVGLGEQAEDLKLFDKPAFISSIFSA